MANVCAMCGRGTTSANNVSHSNRKTKRTMKINLQSKKIAGIKSKVCSKCIKTSNKSAK